MPVQDTRTEAQTTTPQTETQVIDGILANRRALLRGGSAFAALGLLAMAGSNADAQSTSGITDTAILNFALNLEYLEATFYTLAASGTLPTFPTGAGGTGTGGSVLVKNGNNYGSCKVPFTLPTVNAYALEVANEERNHVVLLQSALGSSAVAQPNLDLVNSFAALGALVGVPGFDPFANDYFFLLGSYIFEDVGVSAYHGAAPLIQNKTQVLPPAVQIHAVEAQHAALIRTTLFALDQAATPAGPAGTLQTLTQKISNVRATLDGTAATGTPDDIGVTTSMTVALEGSSNSYPIVTIADVDKNSLGWARTPTQVLNIVYASPSNPPAKGGFFPSGLNGTIA